MKLGLHGKIIVVIELVVLVVAAASSGVALYIQRNTLIDLTNRQLQSVSVLKEHNITRYINHAIGEIEHTSSGKRTHDALVNFLEYKTENKKQEIDDILNEFISGADIYSDIFVMDKKGTIVVSTDSLDEGKIRSNESFFLNAKKEPTVQNFYYDTALEKPELIVTAPIMDDKGLFMGVLAAKIRLEEVSNILLEKSGLGITGETFLVNSYNQVVTELLKEPGVVFKKTLVYLPQIDACLKGNSIVGFRPDYHGDQVFGYWHWLPEIKSCLVTKIDSTEALASIREITLYLLGVIGVIVLLIGIAGYILGQVLTSPLRKLRDFALKVKGGDFNIKADTSSHDEISDIAVALNDMTKHLSSYTGDLEAEVEKRTLEINRRVAEYEELNKFMIDRESKMVELKKEIAALRDAQAHNV